MHDGESARHASVSAGEIFGLVKAIGVTSRHRTTTAREIGSVRLRRLRLDDGSSIHGEQVSIG